MKTLLLLLIAAPLFAQPSEGTDLIDMGGDVIRSYQPSTYSGDLVLSYTTQYSWSITRAANGDKSFTFSAKVCDYYTSVFAGIGYIWVPLPMPVCQPLAQSAAETLGPIAAALTEFYNYHPSAPHLPPVYNPPPFTGQALPKPFRPRFTTAAPAAQPNPSMIFLDGLSENLNRFDLTTGQIVSTVVVPSTSGPLGVRPVATGVANEVWTANGSTGVTVSDMGVQKVLATIPTPSVPQSAPVPAGIVFSNDGTTAFEAIGFYSPDANGNNGALLVFDAVNRKVTSTFPLKNAPTAMLMAPDSYTIYLLSNSGELTYYDVLSGTADLSVSTYTPGLAGGYGQNAVISPDGTSLYWNVGYLLVGFDLTSRKIAFSVNTGLPSTGQDTLLMSQDGASLWLTSTAGMVAAFDVRSRQLLGTFSTDMLSAVYPGPVN